MIVELKEKEIALIEGGKCSYIKNGKCMALCDPDDRACKNRCRKEHGC